MSENVTVIRSPEQFDTLVADGVTLVDFWATWCGPCRQQLPILQRIAQSFVGRVNVAKVNIDENNALAGRFGVESIPALFVFKNGAVIEQLIGVQDEKTLAAALNRTLG